MYEKYIDQIKKINEKVDLSIEFPDWNKSVQFKIKEGDEKVGYLYFVVKDDKVAEVKAGREFPGADVTIEGDSEAVERLFDGSLPVIGAFITKELIIQGKVGDAVAAKVLLDAARLF